MSEKTAVCKIEIDPVMGVVLLRYSGRVEIEDFARLRAIIRDQPGWVKTFAHIFDFTAATESDIPTSALRQLAQASPVHTKDALTIIIAEPGTLHFGLSRMFQALGALKRPNLRLAASLEEAYALVRQDRKVPAGSD